MAEGSFCTKSDRRGVRRKIQDRMLIYLTKGDLISAPWLLVAKGLDQRKSKK